MIFLGQPSTKSNDVKWLNGHCFFFSSFDLVLGLEFRKRRFSRQHHFSGYFSPLQKTLDISIQWENFPETKFFGEIVFIVRLSVVKPFNCSKDFYANDFHVFFKSSKSLLFVFPSLITIRECVCTRAPIARFSVFCWTIGNLSNQWPYYLKSTTTMSRNRSVISNAINRFSLNCQPTIWQRQNCNCRYWFSNCFISCCFHIFQLFFIIDWS